MSDEARREPPDVVAGGAEAGGANAGRVYQPGTAPRVTVARSVALILAIAGGAVAALLVRQQTPIDRLPAEQSPPAAASLPAASRADETEAAIQFYRERLRRDPEETRSQNALAELYLQRVRETGNEDYLPLALQAARDSLAAVEAAQNLGGLTALAHAEFANHDFVAARDHALQLAQLHPGKGEPYAILADASLELGDYDRAIEALQQLRRLDAENPGTETRLARLAVLRGDLKAAQQHFGAAITQLRNLQQPPAETIAWCHWQMGETAFSVGDSQTAEAQYREALVIVPDYFRALSSLGRLHAARGDLPAAISHYEQSVRIIPAVDSMAALGDLYQLAGREHDAVARYELVEQLGEHSRKVHGTPHDRHMALFYADHDFKIEEAYALARGEYDAGRHDIYGADALAWTALKSGRIAEAKGAMEEALKLGTLDARLLYHAGVIARATGDQAAASDYLQRALALNAGFDPLQSRIARETLKEVRK